MFISLISWGNLLKRLNPAEESFNGTALLVEFRIKPDRSSPLRMFLGSLVDQNIGLDPSFLVVLTNLPGIVGCICGDDRRANLNAGNLKCFEGWLVEPGIMDVGRGNCANKGETVPIDQSTQLVPVHLVIAVITGRSPFLPGYPSYPSHSARDQSFGSRSRIGAGRGRSPGTLPSRIIQGGTGVPSIWYHISPERRARYSRWSGRTRCR